VKSNDKKRRTDKS